MSDPVEEGLLTIEVVGGVLLHNTKMFGSMSLYCTIVYNGKELKTKVHSSGGKTPAWGDKF